MSRPYIYATVLLSTCLIFVGHLLNRGHTTREGIPPGMPTGEAYVPTSSSIPHLAIDACDQGSHLGRLWHYPRKDFGYRCFGAYFIGSVLYICAREQGLVHTILKYCSEVIEFSWTIFGCCFLAQRQRSYLKVHMRPAMIRILAHWSEAPPTLSI